jgi:hypothetical protein
MGATIPSVGSLAAAASGVTAARATDKFEQISAPAYDVGVGIVTTDGLGGQQISGPRGRKICGLRPGRL